MGVPGEGVRLRRKEVGGDFFQFEIYILKSDLRMKKLLKLNHETFAMFSISSPPPFEKKGLWEKR